MNFRVSVSLLAIAVGVLAQQLDPNRVNVMIEALSRLSPEQVQANPKLKEALGKVLDATRGTPQFLKLVQQFQLKDQTAGLLEVAVKNPADESGVEAMKLLLASQDFTLLKATLTSTNTVSATKTAEALGNTGEKQAVPLLLPLVNDPKLDSSVRKQAVRSLARTQDGAVDLLKLAKEDKLPADVKFAASTELNAVRWPELKSQAAQFLPLPQGKNTQPLPPVAELLKLAGNVRRGEQVFARQEVNCIGCHKVNDQGTDFGPALSEIGTKLGKDALYESILDPSSGVSFGYEAWSVELKSGDEFFGLIVSETADELTMKDARAVPSRIRKSDITRRTQSKLSIMPAGLQQTMSTQDLVDLVEFLVSLKKK